MNASGWCPCKSTRRAVHSECCVPSGTLSSCGEKQELQWAPTRSPWKGTQGPAGRKMRALKALKLGNDMVQAVFQD